MASCNLFVSFHVQLSAAADEYQMADLKKLANKIENALITCVDGPSEDIFTAVDLVFKHVRDEDFLFWTTMLRTCANFFSKLSTKEHFKDAMRKVSGFGGKMALALFNQKNTYHCPQLKCYGTITCIHGDIMKWGQCSDCRSLVQEVKPNYLCL